MAFVIQDGYTLKGQTSGKGYTDADVLPVLQFDYRPPRASEVAQFRMDQAAARTGEELVKVRAAFVAKRLAKWNAQQLVAGSVEPRDVPITAEAIAGLPDEVITDLVAETLKWKPKPTEEASAGN